MSVAPRRLAPRASVVGAAVAVPALTAGLPLSRVIVSTLPPLSSSPPSKGSVLIWSPGPLSRAVLPLSMLLPSETTLPETLPPVLLARIVLSRVVPLPLL